MRRIHSKVFWWSLRLGLLVGADYLRRNGLRNTMQDFTADFWWSVFYSVLTIFFLLVGAAMLYEILKVVMLLN